jgi:hypothetical protein
MRITENIKKCVVFIGTKKPDEPVKKIKYRGTGFFVSVTSKIPNKSFPYLVTAKHVARQIEGTDFYIRANSKDGKSVLFKAGDDVKWWFHPDPVFPADVAVLHFPLTTELYKSLDCEMIEAGMLLTGKTMLEEGIGEGDEIFAVGLFSKHTGSEKNLPIIRMGNIAMISEEQIQSDQFGNMEAYLVEMRSIGGLSGSPVFVLKPICIAKDDWQIPTSRWRIYLLGLVHGHWDVKAEKANDAPQDNTTSGRVNAGIAMVVPAHKIMETINCKGLVNIRDSIEAKAISKTKT